MTTLSQTDLSAFGTVSSIKLLEEMSTKTHISTHQWLELGACLETITSNTEFDQNTINLVLTKCIFNGELIHDEEVITVRSQLRKMLLSDTVH